ncbi:MAG: DUF6090 family protein [Flavobacteriaceae bacterium]|nr:DUF6090 family protein [Flavobacteriaceae bacterium]
MENKKSKYLKYAIGEIILVVIGILIALQINNWNENRRDRQQEQVLLGQLQSEFQSNLDQLNEKIELRNLISYSALNLLESIDSPLKRDSDSILKYLSITQIAPTYDPIVNDLVSSDRIQLIQNQELKEKLSRWTSEIVQVTEEEVYWLNIRANRYIPYLYEKIPLRSVVNVFWENQMLSNFHLDQDYTSSFTIGNSKKDLDIDGLLDDSKFESFIAQCASFTELINSQSYTLRSRIQEILDIIEEEML